MAIDRDDVAFLKDLFLAIAALPDRHATHDPVWRVWNAAAQDCIMRHFGPKSEQTFGFGPFGPLQFPYTEMGAVNSCDLFGLDELIIFGFYYANRGRYARVVDFGANLGLHSLVMSRCGFEVRSFEPDPHHADLFRRNMQLNSTTVDLHQAAVSLKEGEFQFTRVLGNTTGSHLSGAKAAPYGSLQHFLVAVEAAGPHLAWADLAKIDIEGHEAELIAGLAIETWNTTDALVEVGTEQNAEIIFAHFRETNVNQFSQKSGWRRVRQLADMPTSHRDGSLFITTKSEMPWP